MIYRYALLMLLTVLLTPMTHTAGGAPLHYHPVRLELPDMSSLHLFVSGDEFFNYMHDRDGYAVIQGDDLYYYYAFQDDTLFTLSQYRVGETDPLLIEGLKPVTVPSNVEAIRAAFYKEVAKQNKKAGIEYDSKWSGTFSNLVIYIRFSDQTEFTTSRSHYESRLNSLSATSVRDYYREVSYGRLDMVSYHKPGGTELNISYQDPFPRDYFRPYHEVTNPDGYQGSNQRRIREHQLLARAVSYIEENYEKPEGVDFDINEDGLFDNVAFIIRGGVDGWGDLLWPHRWVLYTYNVSLWGKRVYGYTFQMENVTITTFAHEMFHALGAPDLYRYNNNFVPVGRWDIMASGRGHMTGWMKYYYGRWIDSIPEITEPGRYTLYPLNSDRANIYRIAVPGSSNQFFTLEYRQRSGWYESTLPGEGLIISRVNHTIRGNAQGPPDEVYIFRPGGDEPEVMGSLNSAHFSDLAGRSRFDEGSNPSPFLQDGTPVSLFISNIKHHGDSMTFVAGAGIPGNLKLTPRSDDEINISWTGSAVNATYMVAVSRSPESIVPEPPLSYQPGDQIGDAGKVIYRGQETSFSHTGLESDERYHYTVWSVVDDYSGIYSEPATASVRSGIYRIVSLPYMEQFATAEPDLLPRGWKAEGGATQWELSTDQSYSANAAPVIRNRGYSSQWFYTPGIAMSGNSSYLITFRYRNLVPGDTETLSLHGSRDRHNGRLVSSVIFTDADVNYGDYVLARAVFNTNLPGTYYFALRSSFWKGGVLIDDFRVERAPAGTRNLESPAEFFPNPAVNTITVPVTERTVMRVMSTNGILMLEKDIEGTREVDISPLRPGLYIVEFRGESGKKSVGRLVVMRD